MLLEGRTAIIYGGSGAVGGAVAKAFAREGARVFLAARTEPKLRALGEEIRRAGGEADWAVVDATDHAAVEAHVGAVARRTGPIRLMFNAVGLDDTQGTKLTAMSREKFIAPIMTAMRTWFSTGTIVARHMAENGGGTIIGISANAAREAYENVGGFGVATGAVEHFIRHLARENGPFGVRVACVRSPGSPDSPGVREVFTMHAAEQGMSLEAFERQAGEGTPLWHLSSLAEIADTAVILASDYARVLTATVLNATGGAQVD